MTPPPAAKPFLKWAGGKGQLLEAFSARFPRELPAGSIRRYVEPFVGSGAVFFHVAQAFHPNEIVLMDVNEELVLAWRAVRDAVEPLIKHLRTLLYRYMAEGQPGQLRLFLDVREAFNADRPNYDFQNPPDGGVERAAQVIFLNRTCFNGLFRVNSRALFNVPFGKYKSPRICDADNLRRVSGLLQGVRIECGDFERAAAHIDGDSFVYLDPPYRPLSRTASFNSYSADLFGDDAQRRLAAFYRSMDARGAKLLLSNSDPRNVDPDDDFFDRLYAGYRIERVPATRCINVNPEKRGAINEILVRNY
jgi:DNA adenine methylase